MMKARHIVGVAVAVSIAGHLALVSSLIFAGAHAVGASDVTPIVVDLVPADEVRPEVADQPPPPQAQQPQPQHKASPPPTPQAQPPQPHQEASRPQTPQPTPAAPPPSQVASSPPSYLSDVKSQPPDITTRYGVMLGLPDVAITDAGGQAATSAKLAAVDVAAVRRHLRTCAKRPATIAAGDRIRVVLRVPFTTDGRLAASPVLVEASASAKGPALIESAIAALRACQPYAMLPADKYDEWKVLDLSFTPADFSGV